MERRVEKQKAAREEKRAMLRKEKVKAKAAGKGKGAPPVQQTLQRLTTQVNRLSQGYVIVLSDHEGVYAKTKELKDAD